MSSRLLGEYIDPAKLFDFENQDVTGDFYVFRGRGRGTLLGKHDSKVQKGTEENEELAQNGETKEEEVTYNSSEVTKDSRAARAERNTHLHKVRRGETLSSIAKKHGITVAKLCRANGLTTRSKLRVGQILKYS